jgi:hypothetical protein
METNKSEGIPSYIIKSEIGVERQIEAWTFGAGHHTVHVLATNDGEHVKHVYPARELRELVKALDLGLVEDPDPTHDKEYWIKRTELNAQEVVSLSRALNESNALLEKLADLAKELRQSAAKWANPETAQKTLAPPVATLGKSIILSDVATRIEEVLSGLSLEQVGELGVSAGVVGVAKASEDDMVWCPLTKGERLELRRFSDGQWHDTKGREFTDVELTDKFDVVEVL